MKEHLTSSSHGNNKLTETTDLIMNEWWCLKTSSYDFLKQTCISDVVSFCIFCNALHVSASPLKNTAGKLNEEPSVKNARGK